MYVWSDSRLTLCVNAVGDKRDLKRELEHVNSGDSTSVIYGYQEGKGVSAWNGYFFSKLIRII